MNQDQLLTHYDRVADAPDALVRLRRLVLDLAVRGRLVPQDPADEPASELLKQIEAERKERIRQGGIRPGKPLDPVEDVPFNPPSGWTWLPLGETGNIFNGNSVKDSVRERLKKTGEGHPFIATKDVGYGLDQINYVNGLLVDTSDNTFKVARTEAVLICAEGGSAGRKIGLTDREICFGNKLLANETWSVVMPRFVLHVYLSDFFYAQFAEKMTGIIKGISIRKFLQLPFPLPPLAEQRRIVAKVDELMALLERLEAARAEREIARDRVTTASLVRLTASGADAKAFPAYARFALDVLPALTTRYDQIKQLRRTILDLAVRGRLVPQDPADEPAAELLKQIEAEKARLVKAGEIRKPRAVLSINPVTHQFSPPNGWVWTRIANIGVTKPRNKAFDDHHASFIPMSMIPSKYGMPHEHEPRPWREIKKGYTHFSEGDVGVAKITPCFENGKSVVFRNLTGGIGSGTTELHVIRPLFLEADYIILFLKSPYFIEGGIPKMTGTAGQKRVPFEYFSSSPFPLPPLAEQRRIVAKVDELMALLERLEAACDACETTRHSLLEALLREASHSVADR